MSRTQVADRARIDPKHRVDLVWTEDEDLGSDAPLVAQHFARLEELDVSQERRAVLGVHASSLRGGLDFGP